MATKKRREIPGTIVGEANGLPLRRLRVSEIDAAKYNPREITEHSLEGLKSSIEEFKLVQPLIWNVRFLRLVGGHQRLKTLDPNSTTDVIEVDLDEVREKALNAVLNDPTKQGEFTAAISQILDEIETKEPELFGRMSFDDLRLEAPTIPDAGAGAPGGFPDADETLEKGGRKIKCPSCGHEFR